MKTSASFLAASASLLLAAAASAGEKVFLVVDNGGGQDLYWLNSDAPNSAMFVATITGLDAGETVLGIDYRPKERALNAVGSSNRLYVIDRHTAIATPVGGSFSTALSGANFGFDFNPTIDRIRNVSDLDQNIVLNPITGAVQAVATPVFYAAGDANQGANPNVVHHAYDNNFQGSTVTQLRAIDTNLDVLVKQANNAGTLNTVGALGVDFSPVGGFDVSGTTNLAYAISTAVGRRNALGESTLYTIDLLTGAATMSGPVSDGGGMLSVTAMTVQPELICSADLNDDGMVDGADNGLMLAAWGQPADKFDLDDDGTVDGADWGLLVARWGLCE